MLVLLEAKAEIAAAQRKLEKTFHREFAKKATRDISHPGGTNHDAKVATDGRYWHWSADSDSGDSSPRRLNWFGLYGADERYDLRISVEANTPFEGRNDRVSGFFARDAATGVIYLLHSGRVGGGAKGVGKEAFLAWRNEPLQAVVDSRGEMRFGAVVMSVEGMGATRAACRYIDTVAQFKEAVKNGQVASRSLKEQRNDLKEFYSESYGRRKGRRSNIVDYLSRHGEIVDALSDWRRAKGLPLGARVVKSRLIDMGVKAGEELVELYEVKTSTARADIYTAIGQVLVHGSSERCKRIIVVPHDDQVTDDLRLALQRLRIGVLKCKLEPRSATILG